MPRPQGARALAVLILTLAASAQGCGRPSSPFSTANARAHVNRLAGAIGPRPAGSDANRRAREYLVEQLRFYGFTVRVQEADGVRPEEGLTAHVQNIIAIVPGSLPDAIGLVAHYDSVSGAPGAGDDAAGVAVCLEVGRLLAARRAPRHSVMVLLTDAEEDGLLGAAALVTDPEVKARLRAYINMDSAGNAAPAMIFQTGPGNGWLVRASGAAPEPRGSSMAYEIYSRLPNDTDFTVLSALGAPGLNMGAVGDSYAYHTPQDGPERLTDEVLEQAGGNILAVVQALEDRNLATRTPEQPVFFDLLSTRLVVISPLAALWLGVLALAIGTAGWLRATMTAWRSCGLAATLRTVAWIAVSATAVAGAVVGAAALLRAVREVYHPWYAHPGRFWILLLLAGCAALHAVLAVHARLPASMRGVRHPALAWAVTLPAWLALAGAVQWVAPGAAFLWTLPLGVAGAAALVTARPGPVACLSASLVLVVAAVLWIPDARVLLGFAVPLLGRLGIVAPIAALPGALLGVTLMLAVPALAFVMGWRPRAEVVPRRARWRAVAGSALWLALVVAFAAAYVAPAYTPDRPLRRYAQYQADHGARRAAWEIGSIEPGLDIHASGAPAGWRLASGPLLAGSPFGGMPLPFAFRADVTPSEPPVSAEGVITRTADEMNVQIRIAVADPGTTPFVTLPAGVVPIRSSLPGRVREGAWTASYVAAPTGTLVFTAAFHPADAARLPAIRAGLRTRTLPGGVGAPGVPAWLPAEHAAWQTRTVHLVPIAWLAPDDASR